MDFNLLKNKLNEENVSKIELISSGGDSTGIGKDDELQDNGEYLVIKKSNEEILLVLDVIYKMVIHHKKHVSAKVGVVDWNRRRY